MKNYEAIGIVIGSIIGCVLSGVLVYLDVPLVIICLFMLSSLFTGSYIGRKLEKKKKGN